MASLGLYIVMVVVASVALQRGLSLGANRIGVVLYTPSFYCTDFMGRVK